MERNQFQTLRKKSIDSKFLSKETFEFFHRLTYKKDLTPRQAYKKGVLDTFSLFGFKKPDKHPEDHIPITKANQANLAALLKHRDTLVEIARYTEDGVTYKWFDAEKGEDLDESEILGWFFALDFGDEIQV